MFQVKPSAIFFSAIFLFIFLITAGGQTPGAAGKPLPPGPMRQKVKASCTTCHQVGRITEQHLTRQQWSKELEKMEGLGAVIQDSDREPLLKYLTKNFGPLKSTAAKTTAKKSGSSE